MAHSFVAKNYFNGTGDPLASVLSTGSCTVVCLGLMVGTANLRAGGDPTLNGEAMTHAADVASTETNVEMWYITGNFFSTLDISIPNSTGRSIWAVASSYQSSTAGSGFDSASTRSGASTNPYTIMSTTDTSCVIVQVCGDGAIDVDTATALNSEVILYVSDIGAYGHMQQYAIKSVGSTFNLGWTFATSDDWAVAAVAIKSVTVNNVQKFISETINISDSVLRGISFRRLIGETTNISEGIKFPAVKKFISETLNAIDGVVRNITLRRVLSETTQIVGAIYRSVANVSADIAFIAASGNKSTTSSVSLSVPSGTLDGHVMIAWVMCSYTATPGTITQANWTQIAQVNQSTYFRFSMFYRVASGEPASYSFTSSPADQMHGIIMTFKNVRNVGDPYAQLSNTAYTTTNTTVRAAALTPTFYKSMLVWGGGAYDTTLNGQHIDGPAGMTESGFFQEDPYNAVEMAYLLLGDPDSSTGNKDGSMAISDANKRAMMITLVPIWQSVLGNETVNIAEAIVRKVATTLRKLIAETENLVETITRLTSIRRIMTETMQIVESVLNRSSFKWMISETEQLSEGAFLTKSIRKFIVETIGLIETVVRRATLLRPIAEFENLTEISSPILTLRRFIAEVVNLVETTLRRVSQLRSINETENVSESSTRRSTLFRLIGEGVDASETVRRLIAFIRVQTETVSITEVLRLMRALAVGEVVNIDDGITRTLQKLIYKFSNEVVNIAETMQRLFTLRRYDNEIESVTEATSRVRTLGRFLDETTSIFDVLVSNTSTLLYKFAAETVQLSDSLVRAITFRRIIDSTVQLSDAVKFSRGLTKLAIAETVSLTDDAIKQMQLLLLKYGNDVLNLTEAALRNISFRRVLDETEQLSDAQVSSRSIRRLLTDIVSLIDSSMRTLTLRRIQTTTVNLIDSVGHNKTYAKVVAETFSILDALIRVRTIPKSIDDTVQINDSSVRPMTLRRVLSDTIQALEGTKIAKILRRYGNETLQFLDFTAKRVDFRNIINELTQIVDSTARTISIRKILTESENLLDFSINYVTIVRSILEQVNVYESLTRIPVIVSVTNETLVITDTLIDLVVTVFWQVIYDVEAWRRVFHLGRNETRVFSSERNKRRRFDAVY